MVSQQQVCSTTGTCSLAMKAVAASLRRACYVLLGTMKANGSTTRQSLLTCCLSWCAPDAALALAELALTSTVCIVRAGLPRVVSRAKHSA